MSDLYAPVVDSLDVAEIGAQHVQKRIGEISSVDAYAARRVLDGLESLVLEVPTRTLARIEEWPSSRGCEVFPEPIEGGRGGRTRLHLQLLDDRYQEVFRALCADVCRVLARADDENGAVRDFHQRLVRWQAFLQKHGPAGLGEEARCGLFGELLVLRDLVLPRIPPVRALRAWRGCKKAHQDFQFQNWALEVKTTRASIPDRISISNVQQLDPDGLERMVLTVVHVHENESTGETLPEIAGSIREALPENACELFEDGLNEVGYTDAHALHYSRTKYQLIEFLHFEVGEGFPRLTREQIPEAVKKVQYDLSMDGLRPFRMDESGLSNVLDREGNVTTND